MQNNQNRKENTSYPKMMARSFLFLFLMLVSVFILAGRLTYWQGWLFGGILVIFLVVLSVLFADKKDLIAERIRPGPGTKWWDKIFFALYIPMALSVIVVAALDAGRFNQTARIPAAVYIISYIVLVPSYLLVVWAMWTNKFFSRAVRIQTDRGHYVVQNGPYRFVRHPGYLGGIFAFISQPLALGSLWALIPSVAIVILLVIRTYLEDITLQKELPGYADYARKVCFRLLPPIW